jgi:uncharacterized protein
MENLEQKYSALQAIIRQYQRVIVGYSAGVDSTLLLKATFDLLGKNVLAVTAVSPSYPRRELEEALGFVKQHQITHRLINTKEFNLELFSRNSPDRCYHCKSELYQKLQAIAAAENYDAVFDGSNADDASDFRPGSRAVREQKAISPLKQAGLTKDEIRVLSRSLKLPTSNKFASPCLSSRFPYGTKITPEKMAQVEEAENFIRGIGFDPCRVRYLDETARIEVDEVAMNKMMEPHIRKQVASGLKKIGFKYVTLDLQGFRSGSLNEVLSIDDQKRFLT